MKIQTERLELRTFQVEDITKNFIAGLNDWSIVQYTEARHKRWDRNNVEQYVRDATSDESHLIGIFLSKVKHLGNIRLHTLSKAHQRAELGILLHCKEEWGKGYGAEAVNSVCQYVFDDLKFHRVCADYYAPNYGSARLFEKTGFTVEGIFKDHFYWEGQFLDSIRVAKLSTYD